MGDFAADTLRDSIQTAWALTGRLAKTSGASMKEPVQFFAHPQTAGQWTKAVEVKKVNTDLKQDAVNHPNFSEVSDTYTVTCKYKVLGLDEALWDMAEQDVEDMTEEVRRIILTLYDPLALTGVFFRSTWRWLSDDEMTKEKQELRRILSLTLTKIVSSSTEVFEGYGGVLKFDVSESTNMNSAPAVDYTYTEAHFVRYTEGFSTISYLTKDTVNGQGVPIHYRGEFRGTFSCQTFAKKSDVNAATADRLNNIYKMQTNGQHIKAAFLHTNANKEATPKVLSTTTYVLITNMEKIADNEQLVKFQITGDIYKPTTYGVA